MFAEGKSHSAFLMPSDILLPARSYLLRLPKQCHQLGTKCANTKAHGGDFFFFPLQTTTILKKFLSDLYHTKEKVTNLTLIDTHEIMLN